MIKTLSTAATGLEAQQANIERISNDMANVNTDAYKRGRTEFEELMYQTIKEPGEAIGAATQSPVGIQSGTGVRVGAEHKIFEQGPTRMTYRDYDLMIEGKGFFPIQMPNGEVLYTRRGAFHLDPQGRLGTATGGLLIPQITIPPNAMNVTVDASGQVKANFADSAAEQVLGQIQLISFVNEEGLSTAGQGLYRPSPASGPPTQGTPKENGMGAIGQGALEGSNVNVANSMVEMIGTQRAYEMNTKVMGVADQMYNAILNVKQ